MPVGVKNIASPASSSPAAAAAPTHASNPSSPAAATTKPSPLKSLFSSRKGVVFFLVLVLAGIAAVGFTVISLRAAWRGEMTVQAAFAQVRDVVIGSFVAAVVAAWKLMDTIKAEDVAHIEADSVAKAAATPVPVVNVATGDHATAGVSSGEKPSDAAASTSDAAASGVVTITDVDATSTP